MTERNELLEMLRKSPLEIVFTKVNGDERIMKCSLQEKYLPEFKEQLTEKKKEENLDIIHVWDIVANGWRSIRCDSIRYWSYWNE